MRRWVVVFALLVAVGALVFWLWPSDAGGAGSEAGGEASAAASANEGALPAMRVAPRWTQPVEQRGNSSLMGRVTQSGKGVPGATVTGLAQHGDDVLSDLDCQCDNHCGLKLLECGCPEAAGQLVELVARRTGEGVPLARTKTDREGNFILDGLDDTQLVVWADAPGGVGLKLGVRAGEAPFDVELQGGRVLDGTVSGGDGKPIAGALVTAIAAAHSRFFDAMTDGEGKFKLGPVPDGQVAVVAMRDGLLPDHKQVREARGQGLTFTLDAPRALSGVVRNGGEPVGGARVTLEGMHRKRRATADTSGAFRFERLRPGKYELVAEAAQGRGRSETHLSRLEDRGAITIDLQRGADLSGLVLDDRGAPVPEARVNVYDGDDWRIATTGADGRFLIAALSSGSRDLWVTKRGFLSSKDTRVTLSDSPVEVTVRLPHAPELSGRVVTEDGALVPEFEVQATQPVEALDGGAGWRQQMTAMRELRERTQSDSASSKDGGFTLFVSPGVWDLSVQTKKDGIGTLKVTAPARDLVVTLERGARVEGEVLEADGTPVAGANISLVPAGEGAEQEEAMRMRISLRFGREVGKPADERGRFELTDLSAGEYRVVAVAVKDGAMRPIGSETVRLERRGSARVVIKAKPGRSVSGRVVGPDGKGVQGARVAVRQRQDDDFDDDFADDFLPPVSVARTGADGAFNVDGLAAGQGTLLVMHEETARHATQQVTVPASRVVVRLPAVTEVTARVVGEGRRPVTSYRVNNRHYDTEDGRFTMQLDPGAAKLAFDAEGYAQRLESVDVKEGRNDLGDVLLTRGRPLSGTVRSKVTGAPIAGALVDVDVRAPGEEMSRSFTLSVERGAVRTGADGRYRLERVDPGANAIAVTHRDYVSFMGPLAPGSSAADVALDPGVRLTVTLVGADGKPLPDAFVGAMGPGSRREFLEETAGPVYVAHGLEPGKWVVTVMAGDHLFRSQTVVLGAEPLAVTLKEMTSGAEVDVVGVEGRLRHVLVAGAAPPQVTAAWFQQLGEFEILGAEGAHFRLVPAGTWTLVSMRPSGADLEVSVQQVEIGTDAKQTIQAAPVWTRLEGLGRR